MANNPLISVIMPVYNAEPYLVDAIESILAQSYANFEFLIFDDCSSDSSLEIIKSFNDERITLFTSDENKGYLTHLNRGLKIAKGEFIARMDADDISLPERFLLQIAEFKNDINLGVCGTAFTTFGDREELIKHPEHHKQISGALLTFCSVGHSTVMIRNEVLKRENIFYDSSFYTAEDYELWTRLIFVTKFKNLKESLVKYRIQETQISQKKKEIQNQLAQKIASKYFNTVCNLLLNKNIESSTFDYRYFDFLLANEKLLIQNNKNKGILDEEILGEMLLIYYSNCIPNIINYHPNRLFKSLNTTFFRNLSTSGKIKFALKNCFFYNREYLKIIKIRVGLT